MNHPTTIMARVEDRLFDGLYETGSMARARAWPNKFKSAAKPGTDLSMMWPQFAVWLLGDADSGVINFANREDTKAAINRVLGLYVRWVGGEKPDGREWISARKSAAVTDGDVAWAAAFVSIPDAAVSCAAFVVAEAARYTAIEAGMDAAAAHKTARKKHYQVMADKLINIIKAAK